MTLLKIDPRDAVPIWKQIEDGVRRQVALGGLRPGGPVPSVRELALTLGVNPMTVSKAYQRLTDEGVLEVRRGEGTFVSLAPRALSRNERSRLLRDAARRYVSVAVSLGAPREEIGQGLEAAWAETERGRGGER